MKRQRQTKCKKTSPFHPTNLKLPTFSSNSPMFLLNNNNNNLLNNNLFSTTINKTSSLILNEEEEEEDIVLIQENKENYSPLEKKIKSNKEDMKEIKKEVVKDIKCNESSDSLSISSPIKLTPTRKLIFSSPPRSCGREDSLFGCQFLDFNNTSSFSNENSPLTTTTIHNISGCNVSGGGNEVISHTLLSPLISKCALSGKKKKLNSCAVNLVVDDCNGFNDDELISPILLQQDDVFGNFNNEDDDYFINHLTTNSTTTTNSANASTSASALTTTIELNVTTSMTNELDLPTLPHPRNGDCNTIDSEILVNVLKENKFKILIIDCRFPHEYEGGHIQNAINIYKPDDLINLIYKDESTIQKYKDYKIIFHCEYSQCRAPKMYRLMRKLDRNNHIHDYPNLTFPNIYILEGGYKEFYECDNQNINTRDYCEPRDYVAMNAKPYVAECKKYFTMVRNLWKERRIQ
ncbi:hypothetical protein ABK040_004146 [Willaertia magna]